jgi:hypothetical protein
VTVGRAGELAELDAALGETRAGRGRLVLIAGAPGIGKSRLADAAAECARRAGMKTARGYAVDEPGAPPLWPWLRLMRGWDDAAQLPAAETWEGDAAARFQLYTAMTSLVCGHATGDGLLLILEDMHWADRTSVGLLRHLVAGMSDEPMAVLVTYRTDVPGPLLDAAPALLSSDLVLPLTLGGLSSPEVADWLPQLTGSADARLAERLWERTGGNPLLVRLVAQDLAAHGDFERLMAERPELRRLVAARASELTADIRAVVDAASVLGERIHTALLAEMTGRTDLGSALDEAVASGILRHNTSPPGLRFEHALVRDAVHAELAPSQRAGLHRQAALSLARIGEPNVAGMVASQWRRAGGRDAAGQCQIWAGRADIEARRALAYDDAVGYAELALSCAEQAGGDDAERARLLIRLAEAQFLANGVGRSVSSCAAAADLAEAAGRADLLAQAGLVVHGIGASAYRAPSPGSASAPWPRFRPASTPPPACARSSLSGSRSAKAAHARPSWPRRRLPRPGGPATRRRSSRPWPHGTWRSPSRRPSLSGSNSAARRWRSGARHVIQWRPCEATCGGPTPHSSLAISPRPTRNWQKSTGSPPRGARCWRAGIITASARCSPRSLATSQRPGRQTTPRGSSPSTPAISR